jgi:chromosome segregation ATPase
MKRLEAEKESAEATKRVLEEQRAAFEAQLVDRDLELARLRGEVVVKEELKRTRSRELAAVRATAEAFDAKVRETEAVTAGLRNELEAARADLLRMQSDREALRAELDRKRAELDAVAAMKATVLALVDGLDRLGSDTKVLRTEAAAALETLASARSSAGALRAADEAKDGPAWFESKEDDGEADEGDRPTTTGEEPAAKADEAETEASDPPAATSEAN